MIRQTFVGQLVAQQSCTLCMQPRQMELQQNAQSLNVMFYDKANYAKC